jgi:hypothetical protein
MREPARQHEVTIDGQTLSVWVAQRSRAVWIAYATFRSERIEVTGRTASEALGHWTQRANHAANE